MKKVKDNKLSLHLENFQSISEADITFETGINLIVGQSNSGKSAILRAVRAALMNPNGSNKYIKNKQDKSQIILEYLDNLIEWERTKKDIKYNINNEPYIKAGNSNVFDYLKENNVGFVTDNKGNLINIEGEWDILFPFDRNPQELFKLFENIFSTSNSSIILKKYKEEIDNFKSEIEKEEKSIIASTKKIDAINNLKNIVDISKIKKERDILKDKIERFLELNTSLDKTHLAFKLNKIKISDIKKTYSSENLLEKYEKYSKKLVYLEKVADIAKISTKVEHPSNKNLLDRYILLEDLRNKAKTLKSLSVITNNLKTLEYKSNSSFDRYNKILNIYQNIHSIFKTVRALKEDKLKVEDKKKLLYEEKSKYTVCPLCGSELNKEK